MKPGLAVAATAFGGAGVVFGVSTWIAWLIDHPAGPEALRDPTGLVVAFVLLTIWLLVLGSAILALTFGFVSRAAGGFSKLGLVLGGIAAALALGGALEFTLTATSWRA